MNFANIVGTDSTGYKTDSKEGRMNALRCRKMDSEEYRKVGFWIR